MSRSTVNTGLTPDTPTRPIVENTAYTAFARRILAAHGRRIATGDVEGLRELLSLAAELDTHISTAVQGLRAFGYSWAEIAARINITRQAAQQRWGGDQP